jgi:hypothetical protein
MTDKQYVEHLETIIWKLYRSCSMTKDEKTTIDMIMMESG